MEIVLISVVLCQIFAGISGHHGNIILDLNRETRHEGYHRELITDGSVVYKKMESDKTVTDQLLIIERFPSGMFFDPYELKSENPNEFISVNETINVEAPAYRSHSIEVYIYATLVDGNIKIVLPIHLRYQKPKYCYTDSSSFYRTIVLPSPTVYIAQKDVGYNHSKVVTIPCYKNSDICHWIPVKTSKDIPLLFSIPVGCIEHKVWVVAITSIVIIVMVVKVGHTVFTVQKNKYE